MANPLSISNIYFYVLSLNSKAANLEAFFIYNFDIQTTDFNLLNKWVTHRFNICAAINVKNYEL